MKQRGPAGRPRSDSIWLGVRGLVQASDECRVWPNLRPGEEAEAEAEAGRLVSFTPYSSFCRGLACGSRPRGWM